MPKSPKKPEELTYEQAMAELDEITAALEGESRPLDEMLALNERAQAKTVWDEGRKLNPDNETLRDTVRRLAPQ